MEIIVTHDMADFDAFASAVLAQRLHPEATIVLGRLLSPSVRDFLALHKDRFRTQRYTDIDQSRVERLIIVDVRRESRLKDFQGLIERATRGEVDVHVWDHHAAAEDDVPATQAVIEPVGAVTTLLVEELRRRGLALDRIEATLAAIGIHDDTGSLSYSFTSPRDADAFAWLLRQGANLRMVRRYVRQAFSEEQRAVLASLLGSIETVELGGVQVGFGVVEMPRPVDGLAEVTTEALSLEGHAALFGIYPVGGKRVQVVGRARQGCVDVGAVMAAIGGGGHTAAASAIVKESDGAVVRRKIQAALEACPPKPRLVRQVMSTPAHALRPDTPLSVLDDMLHVLHHTGMPVVEAGRIIGIVSRRDLSKARGAGRLRLPVSSCMTHDVRTVSPDASLEAALAEMVDHDIGRLPVVEGGLLIGIITRSDLIRILYPDTDGAHSPKA